MTAPMRLLRAVALAWLFAMPSIAVTVGESFPDPAMETRARALQRELRCLVCQGESIDESGAPLAADLRHLVRRQMAEGRSDAQIKDFLVARYGDFILMQPPLSLTLGCYGWHPSWRWAWLAASRP